MPKQFSDGAVNRTPEKMSNGKRWRFFSGSKIEISPSILLIDREYSYQMSSIHFILSFWYLLSLNAIYFHQNACFSYKTPLSLTTIRP